MIKKDKNHIILTASPTKVIVAQLNNKKSCSDFVNCISGTFQWNNKPNSILFSWGKEINNLSAHGWLGFPDSVIWCDKSGKMHICDCVSLDEATKKQVLWAVGGMGLLDHYSPEKQGYCKFVKNSKTYDYSDVRRRTNHTVLGYDEKGTVYGFYFNNLSALQINNYLQKNNINHAVLLDGGHVASCNTDKGKCNAKQRQQNIIQFVQ